MTRTQSPWCLAAMLTAAFLLVAEDSDAQVVKSDSKVKASVTRTKLAQEGKQAFDVTLEIKKGWYIYANTVNHNNDFLDDARTKVKLTSNGKTVTSLVKYPAGTPLKSGRDQFNVYQGRVVIPVEFNQADGVLGLTMHITIHATDLREFCFLPAVIKLNIPGDLK